MSQIQRINTLFDHEICDPQGRFVTHEDHIARVEELQGRVKGLVELAGRRGEAVQHLEEALAILARSCFKEALSNYRGHRHAHLMALSHIDEYAQCNPFAEHALRVAAAAEKMRWANSMELKDTSPAYLEYVEALKEAKP